LAGARALALDATNSEAEAIAQDYCVTRNGATLCTVTIVGRTATVWAQSEVPMTFARILGVEQLPVGAEASAAWGTARSVWGCAPIAIISETYEAWPTQYYIWDSDKDMELGDFDISGANRGWLNLDCQGDSPDLPPPSCGDPGAALLCEWMLNGYPGTVEDYVWAGGSSGTETSALQQASVNDVLVIPTYDTIEELWPGKNYYHIVGFAAFHVDQVMATGNPKGLLGHFVSYVTPSELVDDDDFGVRTFALTQ